MFGDEDCLNLNVYTKDVKNKTPVIVFIHGGAFLRGTGASYNLGPQYILKVSTQIHTVVQGGSRKIYIGGAHTKQEFFY